MIAATRDLGRRARPGRAPSDRYRNLATDGRWLVAGGSPVELFPRILPAVARIHAGGREAVVWVAATEAAHARLGAGWDDQGPDHAGSVGAAIGAPCRAVGDSGWLVVDSEPKLHLAFPRFMGTFDCGGELGPMLAEVESFRQAVGLAYLFSGASTVRALIRSTVELPAVVDEPALDPPHARMAWAVPGNYWVRELRDDEARMGWVRAFDRSGSYLSAWAGVNLSAGPWAQLCAGELQPGPESDLESGYWLVDVGEMLGRGSPRLARDGALFDPWRRHGDPAGPQWITTPLLQLLRDVRAPDNVPVLGAWVTGGTCRALDGPARRLADARAAMASRGELVALDALKEAYARTTARFEFPPLPGDPLYRPHWHRTVHDRFAANTWRGLVKAEPWPFGLTDVDTAFFAVPASDFEPAGLRVGTGLGAWKAKGRAVPMVEARRALDAGGLRALRDLIESGETDQ